MKTDSEDMMMMNNDMLIYVDDDSNYLLRYEFDTRFTTNILITIEYYKEIEMTKDIETTLNNLFRSIVKEYSNRGIRIIILRNDLSEMYSSKLYELVANIENNLRTLITYDYSVIDGFDIYEEIIQGYEVDDEKRLEKIRKILESKKLDKNKVKEISRAFNENLKGILLKSEREKNNLKIIQELPYLEGVDFIQYTLYFSMIKEIITYEESGRMYVYDEVFKSAFPDVDLLKQKLDDINKVRNFIAHNKVIDDIYYNNKSNLLNNFKNELLKLRSFITKEYLSNEVYESINKAREEELRKRFGNTLDNARENGIEILDESEIKDKFVNVFHEIVEYLDETYDVEINEDFEKDTAKITLTDIFVDIKIVFDIDDSRGGLSTLAVYIEENVSHLVFINGDFTETDYG